MSKLAEIAEINPRTTADLEDDDEVSFLGMADVSEDGSTSRGHDRQVSIVRKGFTSFLDGDLLVAKITPCFENGKIAQASLKHRVGFGSTEFHVVRAHPEKADSRYLLHFLRSSWVRETGERRMTGSAGQRRVPKDFLQSLDVPLPPLPEQRRIASILDGAARARSLVQAYDSSLDRLSESFFDRLFDVPQDRQGLGALPRLGDVAVQITDGEHLTPRRSATGHKLLSARNVRNGNLDFSDVDYVDQTEFDRISKRCAPRRGDVLLSCSGSVGRVAVVETDEPLVLVRSVAMIRPDASVDSRYLAYYLRSRPIQDEMQRSARSSAQANLFQEPIRRLPVLVPPLLRQETFVQFLDRVDVLRALNVARLSRLNELFASLQYRAFHVEV